MSKQERSGTQKFLWIVLQCSCNHPACRLYTPILSFYGDSYLYHIHGCVCEIYIGVCRGVSYYDPRQGKLKSYLPAFVVTFYIKSTFKVPRRFCILTSLISPWYHDDYSNALGAFCIDHAIGNFVNGSSYYDCTSSYSAFY